MIPRPATEDLGRMPVRLTIMTQMAEALLRRTDQGQMYRNLYSG